MTHPAPGATARRGVRRPGRRPATASTRGGRRALRRPARGRRHACARWPPRRRPRAPSSSADLRERLMAEAETVLVAAADARLRAAAAPHPPARGAAAGSPPRGRPRRPGRRHRRDGGRRPERAAGRRPLPGQARHRAAPQTGSASATRGRGRDLLDQASDRLDEVARCSAATPPTADQVAEHPRRLHQPGRATAPTCCSPPTRRPATTATIADRPRRSPPTEHGARSKDCPAPRPAGASADAARRRAGAADHRRSRPRLCACPRPAGAVGLPAGCPAARPRRPRGRTRRDPWLGDDAAGRSHAALAPRPAAGARRRRRCPAATAACRRQRHRARADDRPRAPAGPQRRAARVPGTAPTG